MLKRENYLYAAWAVALGATVGSLGLSEFMHLVPCALCWYQRILMFPLAWILAAGILQKDRRVVAYALPLSVLGTAVALFHSLLQWGIVKESVVPCQAAVACSVKQLNFFGFVTIPFLSLLAFGAISACLLVYRQRG